MATIKELEAQAAALAEQIKAAKEASKAARDADLAAVQALVEKHGFERADVFPRDPVAVKFRGPNGETWTGRGFKPTWLKTLLDQGATLESFAI
jgi:DNA-binding protein H-NS